MAGWEAECEHTASTSVTPARRAGRTGAQWGLLGLVIGGLAGVIWLLTGAAAQAADCVPGLPGPQSAFIARRGTPALEVVAREQSGPLRPIGGPADSQRPIPAPVARTPRPVAGALQHEASPMIGRRTTRNHARDTTPGDDGPAPRRVYVGALSGLSAPGPTAPTEGGSPAFPPAAAAGGSMNQHGPPIATEVVLMRHDTEAPTVSPD